MEGLEEDQLLWKCEFCGHRNAITLDAEEVPTESSVDYIEEVPATATATATAGPTGRPHGLARLLAVGVCLCFVWSERVCERVCFFALSVCFKASFAPKP